MTSKELGSQMFDIHNLIDKDNYIRDLWLPVKFNISKSKWINVKSYIHVQMFIRPQQLKQYRNYQDFVDQIVQVKNFILDPIYNNKICLN